MTSLSTVVFLSACATMSVAVLPKSYILKVTPDCGDGIDKDAEINIVTDLHIAAQAECANGVIANFTSTDKTNVNYKLDVSYPGNGKQKCVFKKKANTLVFHVKVVAAYGEKPGLVHMDEEEWTVTCTFSKHGTDDSLEQNIVEGLIAPPELLTNVGKESKSTFDLQVVNVLEKEIKEDEIFLGRIVMLKGESKAEDGEAGIIPVACLASDGNASYAILRGGCGDGIIFPKTEGFKTKGTTTISPPFPFFSINFSPIINFRCHFVTCNTTCDGSSCNFERRKRRSVPDHYQSLLDNIISRSETIEFSGEEENQSSDKNSLL